MKIGVLELLSEDAGLSWRRMPHDFFVVKQYASIMPQAVSVWCRNLGHDVYYATYYDQNDPLTLLPGDLDAVFLSCFSRGSGLAYALSKAFKFKNPGILTILGGPHAKQFSFDALRFFDVVVKNCNRELIKEILRDCPRKEVVSTHRPLKDLPTIEERLPEIRIASFWQKKPSPCSFIPIMSSTGCPYSCDFCVDWNNPYNPFPLDRVKADLLFGLDSDKGDDPINLNKQFISQTPYISHSLNIPAPFGETPIFKRYLKNERILTSLPFSFYCKPYLATTIQNYNPIEFYENLIEIFCHMASFRQQMQALKSTKSWIFKGYHPIRNISLKLMIRTMKTILQQLKTDSKFLAFHEAETDILPEYYHHEYERLLGPYKELVSRKDRIPVLGKKEGGAIYYKKTGT